MGEGIAECGDCEEDEDEDGLGGGGGGVAVAGAGDFGGFEGEFGEFFVLGAEVEEEGAEEAEGEVGGPGGEGGVDVTAFAEGEEDVIDEDHAEEDEDGAGDAADGAAAGVSDAEGGGDEGEDEALEGEGEAVVEMGAEGVEFGVGAVFVGDEVGDEVWDAHEVRGEGGGDDAPGGFGDAEDVEFGRGARESAGEVGEGGGFAVGVLDFLTLVEAPLVGGGPPHGAAGDPGALELALFIFLTDFDVADFFLAKVEGERAEEPGAA